MKKFMENSIKRVMGNKKNADKKKLKGFTLVEIIVVLVILAILAAAMIPALTGYIDKANEKTAISEARNVVTAAQTLASEKYALGLLADGTYEWKNSYGSILELADITGGEILNMTVTGGKVTMLQYKTTKSKYVTYNKDADEMFTISSEAPKPTPNPSTTTTASGSSNENTNEGNNDGT